MSQQYALVFEGGGAKGTVFVGALQEFEARNLEPRRLVGTSAGAITATMLAAGYTAEEMKALAEARTPDGKPVFTTFMDIPEMGSFSESDIKDSLTQRIFDKIDIPWVPKRAEKWLDSVIIGQFMELAAYREIFSFIERGGLYAGERFRDWIRGKLNVKKPGLGDSTLSALHEQTGRDLSLVACDTAGREMLVLNHRTAPNCPIDWAVRMSMSIPFIWQEVRWDREWGTYLEEDLAGHTIVDGGVLSNFPLELLVSDDADVRQVMGDTDPDAAGTLGLLIDETIDVPNSGAELEEEEDPDAEGLLKDPRRLKTVKRVMRLMNTMTQAHDKQFIDAYAQFVCRLPAKGYGTTEFDMTPARMNALIAAGRKAMKDYLDSL